MLKFKKTKITALIVVGLIILPVILGACSKDADTAEIPFGLRSEAANDIVEIEGASVSEEATLYTDGDAEGIAATETDIPTDTVAVGVTGSGGQARVADQSQHMFDPTTAAEPSAAEIEGLVFMREEEKLARDVYLTLYEQWGMPVFQNIAGSEQAHMDAILTLLEQFEISDPAAGKDVGVFSDPDFQSLYVQLVEQGRLSQADALSIGAAIEELDIMDLEERLAQTDNEYIIQVYTNLLAGSENHLRAFVSTLERRAGQIYQPGYLDQGTYDDILSGSSGRGDGSGGYQGGNRQGNGGSGNGPGGRNGSRPGSQGGGRDGSRNGRGGSA